MSFIYLLFSRTDGNNLRVFVYAVIERGFFGFRV